MVASKDRRMVGHLVALRVEWRVEWRADWRAEHSAGHLDDLKAVSWAVLMVVTRVVSTV